MVNKELLPKVPGLIWRKKDEIIQNSVERIADLDTIDMPRSLHGAVDVLTENLVGLLALERLFKVLALFCEGFQGSVAGAKTLIEQRQANLQDFGFVVDISHNAAQVASVYAIRQGATAFFALKDSDTGEDGIYGPRSNGDAVHTFGVIEAETLECFVVSLCGPLNVVRFGVCRLQQPSSPLVDSTPLDGPIPPRVGRCYTLLACTARVCAPCTIESSPSPPRPGLSCKSPPSISPPSNTRE